MKNFEKYKTAEERHIEFRRFCQLPSCEKCELRKIHARYIDCCAFAWLDIDVEAEKPMPCPFCGGAVGYREKRGKVWFHCDKCEYSSAESDSKDKAIDAHNRICRAVKACEVDEWEEVRDGE